MKKKILSVLLCLCMVMALLPTTALAESPTNIGNVEASTVSTLTTGLSGVATVVQSGATVTITLTKDIIGRISFNGDFDTKTGVTNVILDTAGRTISGGMQNEALCLDHYSNVTVELIGGGAFTSGRNYAVYVGIDTTLVIKDASLGSTYKNSSATIKTALAEGSSKYNVKIGSADAVEYDTEQTLTGSRFESIVVKQGLTAKVVTFNANGHGTAPGSQQVASGQKVTEPTAPTADGYTFGGWYKEVGCTTPWDFNTDTVNSDITLYAKWTATSSTTLEQTNFTHAYDVQRDPAFPTKNQTIRLSRLSNPYLAGGSQGNQNTGNWKLIKAGTYSYVKSIANSDNLDEIVADVVSKYTSLNSDAVVIYELKGDGTHIAYGVVVAYDAANGNTVFLGDSLSGGAGYLLATGERSGTIYATASEVATDYVQTATYGISLDVDENDVYAFDPVTEGYAVLTPLTVTVANTGDAATGDLTATLSGSGASSFTLSKTSISSIAVSGSDTFTVVPNTNLSAGAYTATVTVSGRNVASKSFKVSFTVNSAPAAVYSISLDVDENNVYAFDPVTEGYAALTPKVVTVTNTGDAATGALTVALSGRKADSFELDKNTISDIPVRGSNTFTVVPKTGLSAGTYTATVTVSGGNSISASFNVRFTVNSAGGGSSGSGGSYTPPTYKVESEISRDADGSVSFSKSNAKKGDAVTITVTPDRYYKVDGVTVKDKNGKEIAVTDNGDGTFTFKMPDSKVTVEPVFSWDNPFADVAEDAYYTPAVEWALKNDITNGTGDGTTFSPTARCTRAQIVTFLWKAAGCPEPAGMGSFTDVSTDAYYAKAVAWAVEQGITNGTGGGKFSPDAICTRSQSMTLLYHAAGSPEVFGDIAFSDVAASSYYADAVVWATQSGVTSGTGDGTSFSPNAACTRGQIITFLYRWLVK